jgi:phosphate transport system substrate-binding protein
VRRSWIAAVVVALGIVAAACNTQPAGEDGASGLSGAIEADGSSTVFPITEAIAEEFGNENGGVRVRVGQSGTGGGFEKFCEGDTDISDASRPIDDDEKKACADNNIEYVELKVAIDGLSVVVNRENGFAECLTTEDLQKIWEPESTVNTWNDVKSEWPDREIKLYGPGADSGTFDYFTDEINGEEGASRSDYQQSEDDNVLVQGVGGDENALGYFGYAYYKPNADKLKAVAVDGGDGCVEPTDETIESGEYTPLSRPLYIYASTESLQREEVQAFTEFYLDNVNTILEDVGYIPLPDEELTAAKETLEQATA